MKMPDAIPAPPCPPFALICSLALLLCAAPSFADTTPWGANAQGQLITSQFITSLCQDTHGNVWIGTEDSGILSLLWSGGASAQAKAGKRPQPIAKVPVLKLPIKDFSMQQAEAFDIVLQLRKYGVAISFINAPDEYKFDVKVSAGTVQDVLKQMVSQHPLYTWREMMGRVVVFPNQPKYTTLLKGIDIKGVSRVEAAIQYSAYLKKHVAGFDSIGVALMGNPDAALFTDTVNLASHGTVLQLFMELLGRNSLNVFSVTPSNDGTMLLSFNEVQPGLISRPDQAAKASVLGGSATLPASALLLANAVPNSSSDCRAYATTYTLKTPINDLTISGSDVYEVVKLLREQYRVAISFIQTQEKHKLEIHVAKGTLRDVLDQLVKQMPVYQWKQIGGRLVLYPNDPRYKIVVSGDSTVHMPRLQAAEKYTDYLKNNVRGFEDVIGTGVKGDLLSSVFTTPVTLPSRARVISQLTALLGDDATATFTSLRTARGGSTFYLDKVELPKPADGSQVLDGLAAARLSL